MGNTFGRFFRVTTFGESHGPALGAVIDGLPPGIPVSAEKIQLELDRRKPGGSEISSPRKEPDKVEILSGVAEGKSTGAPIALLIRNEDAKSGDYKAITDKFRPGHADYTYWKKYGLEPQSGGGRSSGRETVARVAAGAVACALLEPEKITIAAYTVQVGEVVASRRDYTEAEKNPLRCPDRDASEKMLEVIRSAQKDGDSVGGIIELKISGVPAGLGMPVFDKLDAMLAHALVSIGGVKGVEFGEGFGSAKLRGSAMNDAMSHSGFVTNHAGGILGGISTGGDIIIRLAIKPVPSISMPQKTVSLDMKETDISITGRHDACLCPRICPVAEAMAALVLADAFLEQRTYSL